MAWFGRRQSYDRTRLLRKADRARKQGRRKKAIKLYRDVLVVEPNDTHVHRKIAPLLAQTKQRKDAWRSYQRAAEQLQSQGFVDQAIGVLRDAARHLADEPNLWHTLSRLELERHRPADAVNALLEGAGPFLEIRDQAAQLRQESNRFLVHRLRCVIAGCLGLIQARDAGLDRGKPWLQIIRFAG